LTPKKSGGVFVLQPPQKGVGDNKVHKRKKGGGKKRKNFSSSFFVVVAPLQPKKKVVKKKKKTRKRPTVHPLPQQKKGTPQSKTPQKPNPQKRATNTNPHQKTKQNNWVGREHPLFARTKKQGRGV